MDQIKIGKFIATCRKEKNLTQMQLAEKLNITDRAVSKWETGKTMPDSSIMLSLCDILGINVTELLCGERLNMNNKETEKALLDMVKQKEEADKRLLALEWVIGALSVIVLLIPTVIVSVMQMEEQQKVVLILSGFVPSIIGSGFALKIEQIAGYYECKKCGHRYVPTFKAVNLAMHMARTRYMKCPECHQKSWQKKVISKDK